MIIDRPTPATRNGLGNVIRGWPRWMLCQAVKKHKLCSSWSMPMIFALLVGGLEHVLFFRGVGQPPTSIIPCYDHSIPNISKIISYQICTDFFCCLKRPRPRQHHDSTLSICHWTPCGFALRRRCQRDFTEVFTQNWDWSHSDRDPSDCTFVIFCWFWTFKEWKKQLVLDVETKPFDDR